MPALNEFEDETDREHARLDMHKVNDGTMLMGLWWAKWGAKVETFLRDADDSAEYDIAEAEDAANRAEARTANLTKAIEAAVKAFDDIDDERITDAIEPIVSNLENAL